MTRFRASTSLLEDYIHYYFFNHTVFARTISVSSPRSSLCNRTYLSAPSSSSQHVAVMLSPKLHSDRYSSMTSLNT